MPRRSLLLILIVVLLFSLGLLMVFNTSSAEVMDRALAISTHRALYRQLFYLLIGLSLSFFLFRCGIEQLLAWRRPLLFFLLLLLLAPLLPGVGYAANGASRWMKMGSLTLQPSELAKLFLPLVLAGELLSPPTSRREQLLVGVAFLAALFCVFLEPDNGAVALLVFLISAVFFLSALPWKRWLLPLMILALIGGGVALRMPYVMHRVTSYLHPERDLLGAGHQPYQAKIAAGSGGWLGKGIGKSMQKLTYLPEAQNDYIAAIYAEETGFAGMLLLLSLYSALIILGLQIGWRAPSPAHLLLAGSVTFLIGIQVFCNLGVVCGLLPATGLNLPFFSQGGSSLLSNLLGLTLLLRIDWEKERTKDLSQPCH